MISFTVDASGVEKEAKRLKFVIDAIGAFQREEVRAIGEKTAKYLRRIYPRRENRMYYPKGSRVPVEDSSKRIADGWITKNPFFIKGQGSGVSIVHSGAEKSGLIRHIVSSLEYGRRGRTVRIRRSRSSSTGKSDIMSAVSQGQVTTLRFFNKGTGQANFFRADSVVVPEVEPRNYLRRAQDYMNRLVKIRLRKVTNVFESKTVLVPRGEMADEIRADHAVMVDYARRQRKKRERGKI